MAHIRPDLPISRRELLRRTGTGLGMLGMAGILQDAGSLVPHAAADEGYGNPLAPRQPHFPAKAKHVIHLFMNGGPSHVDTFDPKPALEKYAGKELPMENLRTERKTGAAFPSPYKFKKYGESGIEVSEIFQHTAAHVDDMAVIRSMHADVPNHEPSLLLMNCGDSVQVRPSLGSWTTYGLGTENQNLPGFIAMCPGGYPIQETQNWQSAFLPGVYQGTYIDTKHTEVEKLVENIRNPALSLETQRRQLDALAALNKLHNEQRAHDPALEARIHSYELAYRMQMDATDAFDVSREPKHVLDAYGTGVQARQILIARRLVERGVRFVQLWHGAGQPWDNHDDLEVNHRRLAGQCDQAIGALSDRPETTRGCSTKRSCCGAVSLVAPQRSNCRRREPTPARSTGAITTIGDSPSGWRAVGSRAARCTGRPMSSASKRSKTRSMSTTCTPRS